MQNQYSKNSCQFNYWNHFNSRELNSKEKLFFDDDKTIKATIITVVLLVVSIVAFFIV